MNITENVKTFQKLKHQLNNHPMCFILDETSTHFTVSFPHNVKGIDGIRVSKAAKGGKSKALEILLEKCEKAWQGEV